MVIIALRADLSISMVTFCAFTPSCVMEERKTKSQLTPYIKPRNFGCRCEIYATAFAICLFTRSYCIIDASVVARSNGVRYLPRENE